MDLSAYLLNGVVEATAPPSETAADARARGDAIIEMVCAFNPRDAMETMIACHCVMLQFLLNAAMRDASGGDLEPAVLIKARAGAVSISRTLHQWVTKLEKVKKRNESGAAEVRQAAQTPAASDAAAEPEAVKSPAEISPDAPVTSPRAPVAATARPATHVTVPNAQATPITTHASGLPSVVADGSRSNSLGRAPSVAEGDRKRVA